MNYQHFFDVSPDLFCVIGFDRHFITTNPAWNNVMGYAETDLNGSDFIDFVHPEDQALIIKSFAFFNQTEASIEPFEFINRYRHKNGNYYYLSWTGKIIIERQQVYAIARDVTEQLNQNQEFHNINARLKETLDRYESILANANEGIVTINEQGIILSANQATEKIFGYHNKELLGENVKILTSSPHFEVHDSYISNYLKTGQAKIIGSGREVQGKHKQGHTIEIDLSISETCLDSQRFFTGTLKDITSKKQKSLQEQRLVSIVKSSLDAIISIDLEGHVLSWNLGAEKMFGYSEEEILGEKVYRLSPPNTKHNPLALMQKFISSKDPVINHEVQRQHKDGSLIEVALTTSPIKDAEGKTIAFSSIIRNISLQKKVETALITAKKLAEESSREKSEFLANMSHELRTPLNAIIGYSEMLQDEFLDEGLPHYQDDLNKIQKAGLHLLGMINEILELSRLETGKTQLSYQSFDPLTYIKQSLQKLKPMIQSNNNHLEFECLNELGMVELDAEKFQKIIFHLFSNAAKFTHQGKIVIKVQRTQKKNGETRQEILLLDIIDTGIGISSEKLSQLFRVFSQGDGSATREYGGNGLGLAISQQYCTMMGGAIGVESKEHQGSHFSLSLPVKPLNQVTTVAHPDKKNITALTSNTVITGLTHILMIEDDPLHQDMMLRILEKAGYSVSTVSNGLEALNYLSACQSLPALILLDLFMPILNGEHFIEQISSQEAYNKIPIVVISAQDLSIQERNHLLTQVEDIWEKGAYSSKELLSSLKDILGHKE